jgi:homoserine O-acetyltransferase
MAEAFSAVSAPIQFYAFTSDWLYPPYQTEEMVDCLKGLGKEVEYHLIESAYGHDAFLLEHETFAPLVRSFLARITSGGI